MSDKGFSSLTELIFFARELHKLIFMCTYLVMRNYIEKRKPGRPKNSLTTVPVKLVDLLGLINPQTKIPVGRVWLEKLGYEVSISESFVNADELFD
ncbi:MAG: hypothetical protein ACON4R_11555 [Akkermansiaceae bacterium]